jgi:hypothetical protein
MPAGSGRGELGHLFHVWNREVRGETPGSSCVVRTPCDSARSEAHTTPERTDVGLASPRREQKRKHLFPSSDPDGYQAEPGPYSCRSRHDLHHACRTVRTLRVLLLAPCAPHHRTAASCTSNP